jgi:hypothetical protein
VSVDPKSRQLVYAGPNRRDVLPGDPSTDADGETLLQVGARWVASVRRVTGTTILLYDLIFIPLIAVVAFALNVRVMADLFAGLPRLAAVGLAILLAPSTIVFGHFVALSHGDPIPPLVSYGGTLLLVGRYVVGFAI